MLRDEPYYSTAVVWQRFAAGGRPRHHIAYEALRRAAMRDPGGRRGPEASGRAREDAPGVARTRGRPCQVAAVLVLVLVLGGSTGARRCWGFGLCHGAPAGEESVDAIREPRPGARDHLYHYNVNFENARGETLTRDERVKATLLQASMQRRPWWGQTNASDYDFFIAPECANGGFGSPERILNNSTKDFIVVNRFKRSSYYECINKKLRVAEALNNYSAETGKRLMWWPETFPLKDMKSFKKQRPALQEAYLRYSREEDNGELRGVQGNMWVVKGTEHLGRNIEVFDNYGEMDEFIIGMIQDEQILAQKYVENPLLLSGNKFDLRMYVLVTSEPKVYLYREGEVKVSTRKYSRDPQDQPAHVTNYSLQHRLGNFNISEHLISTNDLKQLIGRPDFRWSAIFAKIKVIVKEYFVDIMLDKLIKNEPTEGSWYLFGMDVILDEDLNAYLFEFNICPGVCYKEILPCTDYLDKLYEDMHEEIVQKVVDKHFPPPGDIDKGLLPKPLNGFVPLTPDGDGWSKLKSFFLSLFYRTEL